MYNTEKVNLSKYSKVSFVFYNKETLVTKVEIKNRGIKKTQLGLIS